MKKLFLILLITCFFALNSNAQVRRDATAAQKAAFDTNYTQLRESAGKILSDKVNRGASVAAEAVFAQHTPPGWTPPPES